ncbi:hypothetical protein ACLQ28_32880 [Micromonospora sp. DT201]
MNVGDRILSGLLATVPARQVWTDSRNLGEVWAPELTPAAVVRLVGVGR